MNPRVDRYIERSTLWPDEMEALRPILLGCGLEEDLKWGKPCFSHNDTNLAIMQEMKGFLSLMFFKGALLADPSNVLVSQGPNSRSAKRMEFTSVAEVTKQTKLVKALVKDAIEVERKGLSVAPAPELQLCDELQHRLDANAKLEAAFASLTPGRRREYNMHISQAKQATTREKRIDACTPKILAGKGFRDQ